MKYVHGAIIMNIIVVFNTCMCVLCFRKRRIRYHTAFCKPI